MILYGYQCRECGQEYTSERRGNFLLVNDFDKMSCTCGHYEIKRKYSVSVHRPMHEHFNTSVGKPISSDRQFRDELKRKSEEHFLRTGIPADYQPVDPTELRKQVEASDGAGLDSTNRRLVNEGKRPIRV